jgi:NAD(P)-dependent dehydrogenase (short-subunit alcohol dehydrogenase family)
VVELLAEGGNDVCIADVLAEEGTKTAEEISRDTGSKIISLRCDVSSDEDVCAAFEYARATLGPVLILVNCAAITTNVATVRKMTRQNWDRELAINLTGTFLCIKQALEEMVPAKWGRIVNVSSGAAVQGGYGQCAYVASKAAVAALAKTLCLEHARNNITCNAVLPGLTDTAAPGSMPPDIVKRILRTIPIRRMASPREIANVISFLCTDAASYVNGASIPATQGSELFTF